ncbi:hypothetical protein HMPREF2736_07055 [Corynebacterium sp. HMSC036E10]|uniref:hypothetical protein n=1 Tax=Corynebacterium TaxID=1716 RepID=UPI0008A91401|nr:MULTISPECIES: hypothetical protein [Corynebacterium]OHO81142.1 hypothetical protein HMPREF2736_07055 [Corynebacterium sp. HMSC036E10]PLA27381.1 hypothetical protein CYJ45_09235 [Corynebacterium coyleae]
MHTADRKTVVKVETRRWLLHPGVFALLVVVSLLTALLSYAAVMASSGASSDAGAVSIDTTAALGPDSEDPEKLDLAATSIYLLAPLAASLHGVLFAGSELSSGALLNIAVAARRLRTIFAVRALSLVLLSLITGAILTALSIAGLTAGLRQAEVPSLTPEAPLGTVILGGSILYATVAVIAFAAATLLRRWVVVLVALVAYFVVAEPLLASMLSEHASKWLPHVSLGKWVDFEPERRFAFPTMVLALLALVTAVVGTQRDRAAR